MSEGRNNIDQGGIAWLQLNHYLVDSISLFGVYGAGDNYDELNLGLVYSQTFHEINYYLSVTRLAFFADKSSDNELGFGLSYSPIEQFSLSADAVYSIEADGTFVEFSFLYSLFINPFLTFNPYVKTGLDYGYASTEKNGYNHTALGAIMTLELSPNLSFNLVAEHSLSGTQVKRETKKNNHSWLGIRAVYNY